MDTGDRGKRPIDTSLDFNVNATSSLTTPNHRLRLQPPSVPLIPTPSPLLRTLPLHDPYCNANTSGQQLSSSNGCTLTSRQVAQRARRERERVDRQMPELSRNARNQRARREMLQQQKAMVSSSVPVNPIMQPPQPQPTVRSLLSSPLSEEQPLDANARQHKVRCVFSESWDHDIPSQRHDRDIGWSDEGIDMYMDSGKHVKVKMSYISLQRIMANIKNTSVKKWNNLRRFFNRGGVMFENEEEANLRRWRERQRRRDPYFHF